MLKKERKKKNTTAPSTPFKDVHNGLQQASESVALWSVAMLWTGHDIALQLRLCHFVFKYRPWVKN